MATAGSKGTKLYDPPEEEQFAVIMKGVRDWYTIGLKLNIPTDDLDGIKDENPSSANEQKKGLLRVWKSQVESEGGEPKWQYILDAVKALGITKAVKMIEEWYDPTGVPPQPNPADRPTMAELYLLKSRNQKVKIIDTVAAEWTRVGFQLIASETVSIIRSNHSNNVVKCCEQMFEEWLHDSSASWETLITVLEDTGDTVLASNVKKILNEK